MSQPNTRAVIGTDHDVSFFILRGNEPAVECDLVEVRRRYQHIPLDEYGPGGVEVAPGVRVKLLSTGDHLYKGKVYWGAMVVVQRDLT